MNYYEILESLIMKHSKTEPKLTRLQLQRKVINEYASMKPLTNEMLEAVDNDTWEMISNYHKQD